VIINRDDTAGGIPYTQLPQDNGPASLLSPVGTKRDGARHAFFAHSAALRNTAQQQRSGNAIDRSSVPVYVRWLQGARVEEPELPNDVDIISIHNLRKVFPPRGNKVCAPE